MSGELFGGLFVELTVAFHCVVGGMKVAEVCRKHGISQPTYYNWKSKYGGMSVSDLKRVIELEAELSKLKRIYAEMAMENDAIKALLEKKL